MLLLTSSSSPVRLNEMINVFYLHSVLSLSSALIKWSRSSSSSSSSSGWCCQRSLQPAGCADVEGGGGDREGDRVWKMLHGCPQFSGLSFKINDCFPVSVRRLVVRSESFQQAARRCPKDEKPGGVADSSSWGAIFPSLQPLGGWMERERERAGCVGGFAAQ